MQICFNVTLFVLLILTFVAVPRFAACHVITLFGSGSRTGADWNNALAGLLSTVVPCDVCYLADGSYTRKTADSSSRTIQIGKANASMSLITTLSSVPPQLGGSALVGKYSSVAGCIK